MDYYLNLVSVTVINTMSKGNLKKKEVCFSYNTQVTVHLWEKSAQARTQRQELLWKPWRSAACWLAICDLLSQLSYKTQSHLSRGGLTTHGRLDHLHPSFYRKHPHRLACRLNRWELFLNRISLFLEPFHWCGADEAHHRTSKTNRCKTPTSTKRLVSRKETIVDA